VPGARVVIRETIGPSRFRVLKQEAHNETNTAFYQSVAPDAAHALTTAAPRDEALTVAGCNAAAQYVAGVVTDIEAKQALYTAATNADSWELAHEDALNLRDGYLFLALYFQNDFTTGDEKYREPGLARNLERLASTAEGPIMVYAHNAHCAKANSIGTSRSVGTILANTADFGSRYFVIAQGYAEGTESILNNDGGFGQRSVAGTLGSALGEVDPSAAFLLGTNSTDFAMTVPRVGDYGDTVVPANDFDALAFVRHVTPTTERN
jgi:erythromycin esterase-like protein